MFKKYVQRKLEHLVRVYFAKHQDVKLVVVVGAAGKTTTKISIATVLNEKFRVRMEDTNHNTQLSVPPALLGVEYPEGKVHSPLAWHKVFKAMRSRIAAPTDVDVIIQELGTDHPGEIPHFGHYLKPDIAVVTSVVPEHMEFFGTVENVAREELSVTAYAAMTFINRDDIDAKFADFIKSERIFTYGVHPPAEYHFLFDEGQDILTAFAGDFISPELGNVPAEINLVGEHNLKAGIAAGAIGAKLGMMAAEINQGLGKIRPVPGRMNILQGQRDTTLIDDTYNSSPAAAIAALKTLYNIKAVQRIAILGSMNELGDTSPEAHKQVGQFCDPTKLEMVVTIGRDARQYLVPAAQEKGNRVKSFLNPIEAGAFVSQHMQPGAVILAKGSQNGVFAEEALKILLRTTEDDAKLVRQSLHWLDLKRDLFTK
ncbi:MAG: UDP-N-acetylmuramoyl-tripeptide--D-alanyl-D-alanine ligase [Candidatus Nomurabacteria bacterium]|jgi:UDP-N-acetylmuramoyl-tripeptide--D-alanyl-D-alanine ligase|nr:UDP-N-acetylmuramoyl-tripeptide--D-alanyl-D-alanine ligase [Candidatus Nomurabacteria bacterium]